MKNINCYLLLLIAIVLTSCGSRKMLIKRQLSVVDTTIIITPKKVESKLNFKVKDTIITDKKTGIKITFKQNKDTIGVKKGDIDEGEVSIEVPEDKVSVKLKKIEEDFKDLSLEKAKVRNESKQKKDSLNNDYKKKALEYPPKLGFWGTIEKKITDFIVGIVILIVVILTICFFIKRKQ